MCYLHPHQNQNEYSKNQNFELVTPILFWCLITDYEIIQNLIEHSSPSSGLEGFILYMHESSLPLKVVVLCRKILVLYCDRTVRCLPKIDFCWFWLQKHCCRQVDLQLVTDNTVNLEVLILPIVVGRVRPLLFFTASAILETTCASTNRNCSTAGQSPAQEHHRCSCWGD